MMIVAPHDNHDPDAIGESSHDSRPAAAKSFQFGVGHLLTLAFVTSSFLFLTRWQQSLNIPWDRGIDYIFFFLWAIATIPALFLARGRLGRAIWLAGIWSAISTIVSVAYVSLQP